MPHQLRVCPGQSAVPQVQDDFTHISANVAEPLGEMQQARGWHTTARVLGARSMLYVMCAGEV